MNNKKKILSIFYIFILTISNSKQQEDKININYISISVKDFDLSTIKTGEVDFVVNETNGKIMQAFTFSYLDGFERHFIDGLKDFYL